MVEIADKHHCKPAQISLAWLLSKPGVVAPVVGVSKLSQLEDLIGATAIELTEEDIGYLEELYQPLENLLSIGAS